jgi:thiol-disulfide isomerase/thioredoxin
MKKLLLLLLIIIIVSQYSCNNDNTNRNSTGTKESSANAETVDSVSDKVFVTDWKTLTKSFMTWYNYSYYNIHLSQDFIGLNIDSIRIDKTAFLNQLMTGNVVAFKIKIVRGEPVYKLFKLNSKDESIKTTIKQMASTEMTYHKMEGTEIPDFHFTDLNGNVYDKSSTKGKIVVLKCWFIHCVACIAEFPALNKLVEDNKGRNDILFISLALDDKRDLLKFLKTKEFKYAVVPRMKNYVVDKLNVTEFPTHLLVNKNGKIIKVVNRIEDLVPFIKKELARDTL